MSRIARVVLVVACLSLGTVAVPASPASAHGASHLRPEITHGRVTTLPGGTGLGLDVRGIALMVRVGDHTTVALHVRGLAANTTYPAHVHDAPCAAPTFGGKHYQHVVGGPVDAVNEMWPAVSTNRGGAGFGFAGHDHRARAEARSIVIHYPPDTSIRLACVDLA